jgi:hypothetical protein
VACSTSDAMYLGDNREAQDGAELDRLNHVEQHNGLQTPPPRVGVPIGHPHWPSRDKR